MRLPLLYPWAMAVGNRRSLSAGHGRETRQPVRFASTISEPLPASQQFGNLHGVEGGTLADLVADNPQVQRVVQHEVAADAPD